MAVQAQPASVRLRRLPAAALFAAVLLAAAALPALPAWAATSEEKQAEADAIFAQIDDLQTQLNSAYDEYDAANAAYEEANAAYEQANSDHEAALAKMEEAQATIDEQTARIAQLQDQLGDYAVTMYKYDEGDTFFNVILGAQSFEDFLTAWDAMTSISEEGADLVSQTKDAREATEAAKATYDEQNQVAEESMQRAQDSMATAQDSMAVAQEKADEIEDKQAQLKAEADKITEEVAELQAQEEAEAEAAHEAEEAAKAAAASAAASNSGYVDPGTSSGSGNGSSGTGVFTHPLPSGTISSTFGYRDFDGAFHKGLDLAAPEGTPYYAADSGTVIYATNDGGYNGGAGNWVVISHGNGIVTKYMHSSATYVTVGQRVERGENIGAVGNTGDSYGAHLHFQVEVNGSAVDPLGYL